MITVSQSFWAATTENVPENRKTLMHSETQESPENGNWRHKFGEYT
jgi:hypothetical protein